MIWRFFCIFAYGQILIHMKQSAKDFLKGLTDKEIYEIDFHLSGEIQRRIIELLKKHGCTSVYIPKDSEVEANVSDSFGTHGWEDGAFEKWVNVNEVGYTDIFEGGKVYKDILYIITDKDEQYSGEELNGYAIWDLYSEIKKIFEKDYSDDNS